MRCKAHEGACARHERKRRCERLRKHHHAGNAESKDLDGRNERACVHGPIEKKARVDGHWNGALRPLNFPELVTKPDRFQAITLFDGFDQDVTLTRKYAMA